MFNKGYHLSRILWADKPSCTSCWLLAVQFNIVNNGIIIGLWIGISAVSHLEFLNSCLSTISPLLSHQKVMNHHCQTRIHSMPSHEAPPWNPMIFPSIHEDFRSRKPIANEWIYLPWHPQLIGGWATPLKNMKVNWDDDIPNIWNKFSKPPTS